MSKVDVFLIIAIATLLAVFFIFPAFREERVNDISSEVVRKCNRISLDTRTPFREENEFCITKDNHLLFEMVNDGSKKFDELLVNINSYSDTQSIVVDENLKIGESQELEVAFNRERIRNIEEVEIIPYVEYENEIYRCQSQKYSYSLNIDECFSN